MGGVAAIVYWDGRPCSSNDIHAILSASAHRASDGTAIWAGAGATLGHQRFITTPEQAFDSQPVIDERSSMAFVFDGRLDNRAELAAQFGVAAGSSISDAAIAFDAFLKWGADTAARLLGDFSFIAWNWRDRRLTAARDHMGIRPLHFWSGPGVLVCATDIAQVLAHRGVPREPDTDVAAAYLACDVPNTQATLFRGVSRVPPGHVLDATHTGARLERFWAPEPSTPIRYTSDREYAAHCRHLLVAAVDARLRSDRPVAAALSGGLDSSSVVAIAHRVLAGHPPAHAYSLIYPDRPEADERPFIDAVAAHCVIEPVRVAPARVTARALRDRARAWCAPPPMPADEMAQSLYASVRAHGHRVVLDGAGGDALFAGSVFQYADLLRAGHPLKAWGRFRDDYESDAAGWSRLRFLQAGIWPLLPVAAKRTLRPLARRAVGVTHRPAWLLLERPLDPVQRTPRGGSFATEEATRMLNSGMQGYFLECGERADADLGLESRHPFLDARLVQFALDIPDDQRRRGAYTKYVLRQALAGDLPPLVAERLTKGYFDYCVVEALDALGGERFFRELAIAKAGWVDAALLAQTFRSMRRTRRTGPDPARVHLPGLWMAAAVEVWFRASFNCRSQPQE